MIQIAVLQNRWKSSPLDVSDTSNEVSFLEKGSQKAPNKSYNVLFFSHFLVFLSFSHYTVKRPMTGTRQCAAHFAPTLIVFRFHCTCTHTLYKMMEGALGT